MGENLILLFIIILAIGVVFALLLGLFDASYMQPNRDDVLIECGYLGYDKAFIENAPGFGNWNVYCAKLIEPQR